MKCGRLRIGKVRLVHTSWVEGAQQLAEELCRVKGVKNVIPGELNRHGSRGRKRKIKIEQGSNKKIKIVFGGNDGHQDIIVVPEDKVDIENLAYQIKSQFNIEFITNN